MLFADGLLIKAQKKFVGRISDIIDNAAKFWAFSEIISFTIIIKGYN